MIPPDTHMRSCTAAAYGVIHHAMNVDPSPHWTLPHFGGYAWGIWRGATRRAARLGMAAAVMHVVELWSKAKK